MSPKKAVIYHNPGCSKSRETLQILHDSSVEPEIIGYLETPPSAQELKRIIEMLGLPARDLLRHTEPVYTDANLDNDSLSDDDIINAIVEHPALLQRPIVICGDKAIIGRPPALVLDIIA
jgi:arsenate reductase